MNREKLKPLIDLAVYEAVVSKQHKIRRCSCSNDIAVFTNEFLDRHPEMHLTEKETEAVLYVQAYANQNGDPPSYMTVAEQLDITKLAAFKRLKNNRHLMKRNDGKR